MRAVNAGFSAFVAPSRKLIIDITCFCLVLAKPIISRSAVV